ncbi:MAG TPA: HD domain-containing protein [Campylobacteraceae bacterium]|nr:HD domain-containing protein [Campylobacteraceae bacterium]
MDIEKLLREERSDFEVSKTIKEEIRNYLASLPLFFESDQGKHFLVRHTKNIDHIITNVYRYIVRKQFGEYLPLINSIPVTIIAMGSYGREQLAVYSDIDLLILYKEIPGYNLNEVIGPFLNILWDSGMKLGHRVHAIDTLIEDAEKDHTIKTALLESRFVYGSRQLWTEYEHHLKRIRTHEPIAFIREKMAEREATVKKYPFNMQPDIKNAPGGLRDANLLFWIAKVRFNVTKIRELPQRYIDDHEYRELMRSLEFLFRVRSALHLSAGGKSDQLVLELIPSVAEYLKLSHIKTVQKTFEAMHHIQVVSAIVIKRITHTLFFEPEHIPLLRASRIAKNHYFCHHTHYGSLYEKEALLYDLIEESLIEADNSHTFDISFVSMLKFSSRKKMPGSRCMSLVKSIFYKEKIATLFHALYDAGHLFYIIEPLRKVAYLPQFDGYHVHPVDLHSIDTLKALEDIRDPFVQQIYDGLNDSEKAVLRISAFLHDCGKGRKSDHSRLGANLVKRYALRLGFTPSECEMIYTLILHHVLMSNTAQREDIYNEKVIFSFTAKIRTRSILQILYVLTYADISAVSPTAYTANNAGLLKALYYHACDALENRSVLSEAARRNTKEVQLVNSARFREMPKTLQKKILGIDSNLFFLRHTPEEIIDIALWAESLESDYAYRIDNDPFLSITIIRKKSVNLGYILSKLSALNLASMDLFKLFDGIKYFHIAFEEKIPGEEVQYVRQILDDTLLSDKKPKLPKVEIAPSEITIDCEHSKTYAKMQVVTKDQKGLMANIITAFDDIGIDIASAKIQTIKKRARNLFLIEKEGPFCENRERLIAKLTNSEKG